MPKKVAVMIDGGHVRSYANRAGKTYDPDYIEKIARASVLPDLEEAYRFLYYDCAPFSGTIREAISGAQRVITSNDQWLKDLSQKDLFAVRLGKLKYRGQSLRKSPIKQAQRALTDADFAPTFEQKGVDMRIGIDMAILSHNRSIDLIAISTNDTDCIPAMKHARRSGLQVALIVVPGYNPTPELLSHCDFQRRIAWPT